MREGTDEMVQLLEEWFPDATPEERLIEWRKLNLELIENGTIAALLLPNGDILYKHTEHCTDEELTRKMTPEQYRLWVNL